METNSKKFTGKEPRKELKNLIEAGKWGGMELTYNSTVPRLPPQKKISKKKWSDEAQSCDIEWDTFLLFLLGPRVSPMFKLDQGEVFTI